MAVAISLVEAQPNALPAVESQFKAPPTHQALLNAEELSQVYLAAIQLVVDVVEVLQAEVRRLMPGRRDSMMEAMVGTKSGCEVMVPQEADRIHVRGVDTDA